MPNDPAGLFATPRWLRNIGVTSWLAVGLALLVIGAVWLMALTHTIVMPLIAASVIAAAASPAIGWAKGHRVSRGLAAALFLVLGLVFAAAVAAIVLGGVTGESDSLRPKLTEAKDTITGWATDLGIDASTAQQATKDTSASVSDTV